MSFVQKLRMSNIFPAGGNMPFTPPDTGDDGAGLFNYLSGKLTERADYEHMRNRNEAGFDTANARMMQPQPALGQIANNMAQPTSPTQGMNVVFDTRNQMTDYQKQQLGLERAKLAETQNVNRSKIKTADDNTAIKNELADLKVKNENLTAADKVRQKAAADKELLETKGKQTETAITTKADQDRVTEQAKQNNRIAIQGMREGDVGSIPGPDGNPIPVWFNPGTKTIEPIKLDGKTPGPITKVGTAKAVDPTVTANRSKIKEMTQGTLDALGELLDENDQLRPEVARTVGGSRWLDPRNYVPGNISYTGEKKLDHFLAKQLVGLLGEIKSQSKTGATGFGSMSNKDLKVLENAASSISKDMPDEDILKELLKVKPQLKLLLNDDAKSSDNNDETATRAAALIKKYGG